MQLKSVLTSDFDILFTRFLLCGLSSFTNVCSSALPLISSILVASNLLALLLIIECECSLGMVNELLLSVNRTAAAADGDEANDEAPNRIGVRQFWLPTG